MACMTPILEDVSPDRLARNAFPPASCPKDIELRDGIMGEGTGGIRRNTHEKRCAEPYEEEADGERWEWRSGGLEGVADGDDE